MTLALHVRDWPEPWRSEYEERLSIMLADDVKDAERQAEKCVRKRWLDIEP